ncbi:RNA polymerase sigma24 factor [Cellvibrio zantedeschiae]|uniref:RNA polymerase sigma24 factor n=1 Tax=Cellvibrio zantedeschiae TaxID=1237077 RepID=A0ABQ3B0V5_9GAMM|nr:RNA polymerase sigma factor [Cellvibrio zantedeschiae]GGY73599.1 RNA polymerase sigma24 factor [Cellvibrio zantedeschiae]
MTQHDSRFDAALLDAACKGDREAIIALLKVAQPDIRRYAKVSCKLQDVDDAVQESLWLVYNRIGTLRAVTSFAGWLFAIVRRECMRLMRKVFIKTDDISEFNDDPGLTYSHQLELRQDLSRAIQSLPEHYREVVLLRDIEELSVNDIALLLNLTREAVKARLHRARMMVREYLLD